MKRCDYKCIDVCNSGQLYGSHKPNGSYDIGIANLHLYEHKYLTQNNLKHDKGLSKNLKIFGNT